MFNLIAYLIVIFGGINWFCIGLFQFDIIAGIFGSQAHFVSRFLYCIIGVCAVYSVIALPIKKGQIYEPKKSKKGALSAPAVNESKDKSKNKDNKDESENEDKKAEAESVTITVKPKNKSSRQIKAIKKDLG